MICSDVGMKFWPTSRCTCTYRFCSDRSLVIREHATDRKGEDVKVVKPDGGVGVWTMLGRQQPHPQQQEQEPGQRRGR